MTIERKGENQYQARRLGTLVYLGNGHPAIKADTELRRDAVMARLEYVYTSLESTPIPNGEGYRLYNDERPSAIKYVRAAVWERMRRKPWKDWENGWADAPNNDPDALIAANTDEISALFDELFEAGDDDDFVPSEVISQQLGGADPRLWSKVLRAQIPEAKSAQASASAMNEWGVKKKGARGRVSIRFRDPELAARIKAGRREAREAAQAERQPRLVSK